MARRERIKGAWRAGGLAVLAIAVAGCATTAPPAPESPSAALGVRIEGLRLSAAGYMLDLRYRVVEVDRAQPLFDRKTRPVLLAEESGAMLGVPDTPKLGQLRSTNYRNVKPDRTYSILFANPGRFVQPGTKMALAIGEARIDGLVVE